MTGAKKAGLITVRDDYVWLTKLRISKKLLSAREPLFKSPYDLVRADIVPHFGMIAEVVPGYVERLLTADVLGQTDAVGPPYRVEPL